MAGYPNNYVGYCGYAVVEPEPSPPSNQVVARCGYAVVEPSSSTNQAVAHGSSYPRTHAYENQNTTRAVYQHGGGSTTAKFTETAKAGSFVDRRSGNHGYRQELKYNSSVKVNDRARGCTTEYETQVRVKQTTTYNNSAPKNSNGNKNVKYYY